MSRDALDDSSRRREETRPRTIFWVTTVSFAVTAADPRIVDWFVWSKRSVSITVQYNKFDA
jgi:hypothetical protein